MGLDICIFASEEDDFSWTEVWHGAYSAFHQYREEIKKILNRPGELEEFVRLWLKENSNVDPGIVLDTFFAHSDYDGEWDVEECKQVLFILQFVFEKLPKWKQNGHIGIWKDKTQVFIDGLKVAIKEEKKATFA